MSLTVDFDSRLVTSDASITDSIAFHNALRDIEVSDDGILYPVIHTYKLVNLGGGAVFPAIAFINGWTLQFVAGSFELSGGNYDLTVNPVANCYVKINQSAAYAVSSALGNYAGPTPEQVASAVWSAQPAVDVVTAEEIATEVWSTKPADPVIPTPPTPEEIASEVWLKTIEAGFSAEALQRIFLAILAGKVTGAGTATESFRSAADTKNRAVITTDQNGNRTQVTLDGT